jgi:predicted TPR repeat methyltransferase
MNPAQVQSTVNKAIALHRLNQLPKAEKLYKKVLKADPYCVSALHFYGLLRFNRGQIGKATELILAAIGLDPDYIDAHLNLGNIYLKTARLSGAQKCYEKALEIDPTYMAVMTNLGVLLRYQRKFDESIRYLTKVTVASPNWAEGYFNLANTYRAAGRYEDALANYEKAVECNPQFEHAYQGVISTSQLLGKSDVSRKAIESLGKVDRKSPTISHMQAAYSGEHMPRRADDDYIRSTFDAYADNFESSLANLEYRAPALLGDALNELFPAAPTNLRVLDAGCGTGLADAYLRPYARKLIGMDLSQNMLDRAHQKGSYDKLICASLEEGVARYNDYFDLVVSVDTLIYFGDLNIILRVTRAAIKNGGYLVFTLERSGQPDGYELCQSGRYAHTEAYVTEQLESLAYTVDSLRSCVLRKEFGQDVQGWLAVAHRTD